MPPSYELLDQREEDELHKNRLLNIEARPFQRLTKHLGLAKLSAPKLPTPPPEGADSATATGTDGPEGGSGGGTAAASSSYMAQLHRDPAMLKEDIQLEFAVFDSTVARLQFIATSNEQERERYARDRERILATMESVRASNAQLRGRLDAARATLAQRRKFDELADRITGNRLLRPRAEQAVNLAKLAEECEELQRESATYGGTWRERKEQFDKLVGEGVNLLKLIRDEKEEVERREGMDEDADDAGAATADDATPGKPGSQSGNATPARPGDGATPRPTSPGPGDTLKPRLDVSSGSFSRGGSQAPSLRAGSQNDHKDDEPEEGEDVEMGEMAESTQAADTPAAESYKEGTPQITVEAPTGADDKMDTT